MSYTLTKEVVLNPKNSELQNLKILMNELTHTKLHRADNHERYTKMKRNFKLN